MQLDAANRVLFMRRGPAASRILTATYRYFDDDRVRAVTYGNEASVEYTYYSGTEYLNILLVYVV